MGEVDKSNGMVKRDSNLLSNFLRELADMKGRKLT